MDYIYTYDQLNPEYILLFEDKSENVQLFCDTITLLFYFSEWWHSHMWIDKYLIVNWIVGK